MKRERLVESEFYLEVGLDWETEFHRACVRVYCRAGMHIHVGGD